MTYRGRKEKNGGKILPRKSCKQHGSRLMLKNRFGCGRDSMAWWELTVRFAGMIIFQFSVVSLQYWFVIHLRLKWALLSGTTSNFWGLALANIAGILMYITAGYIHYRSLASRAVENHIKLRNFTKSAPFLSTTILF
jgi:hypothetical protein